MVNLQPKLVVGFLFRMTCTVYGADRNDLKLYQRAEASAVSNSCKTARVLRRGEQMNSCEDTPDMTSIEGL